MSKELKYSSVLTGSGFMMYEFKQVALLKLEKLSDKEIRAKVINENLFQHKKTSSLQRGFPFLLKRVNALDHELRKMVVHEGIDVGKVINLYSIMKCDRLFFEFMNEEIKDQLEQYGGLIEKKNLNMFFTNKEEQSHFLRNLADSTKVKLKNVFLNILFEVGILKDLKSRELQRIYIDEQFRRHLIKLGDKKYLQAMGDDGEI